MAGSEMPRLRRRSFSRILGSGAVGQALEFAILIATPDLVAGLARDIELPAKHRHLIAVQKPGDELQPLFHDITLLPRHLALLVKGQKCNPSIRNELSPMPREGHSRGSVIYSALAAGRCKVLTFS